MFGFDVGDSSANLKLYMAVMKKMGVKMRQEEMFVDYQGIYNESVKRCENQRISREINAQVNTTKSY